MKNDSIRVGISIFGKSTIDPDAETAQERLLVIIELALGRLDNGFRFNIPKYLVVLVEDDFRQEEATVVQLLAEAITDIG